MNQPAYPTCPRDPISFRTAYWIFLISLASLVWVSLSAHLGLNYESRQAADSAHWHLWIDQRFTWMALLVRPACWVLEELIFRGFALQALRRRLPLWAALPLSAVLFSVWHVTKGAQTMAVAFVLGYFLGWVMVRTNSIYASIIGHVSVDACAFYVVWPLMAAGGRIGPGAMDYPAWAWVLSAAVIITGLLVLRREFRRGPALDAGLGAAPVHS